MAKVIAFTRRNLRSSPNDIRNGRRSDASSVINITNRIARIDAPARSDILLSVVIATYGRPHLLSHCLASLLWQRFDTSRYEIIVVDDKPDSCTRDIVADWATHAGRGGPKVVYIPSNGPHGLAAARNRGWRAARGRVIAFTDDDTVARSDWLQTGWNAFDQDVQAVWGRVVVPYSNSLGEYERHLKNTERVEFTVANCFCRRQVLEELAGFDERFALGWRDDTDLYFRLLQRSGQVVHVPSAVMTRPIRPQPWGECLRQQKKEQSDALLFKKHRKLYRQKIRKSYQRDCYLVVAALLSFFIALGAGQTGAAIAGAATWLFLTGWFGLARLGSPPRTAAHIAEAITASILVPLLAVFWRLIGAVKFRVPFL